MFSDINSASSVLTDRDIAVYPRAAMKFAQNLAGHRLLTFSSIITFAIS
jgi:hypothetical protein